MQLLLAILGSLAFVALGFARLQYMDGPPILAWATIGFIGLGAVWILRALTESAPQSRFDHGE